MLSLYNRIIIGIIILLFALNIVNSLMLGSLFALLLSSIGQRDLTLRFYLKIIIRPVCWTFNFLTLLGLLYLFHY